MGPWIETSCIFMSIDAPPVSIHTTHVSPSYANTNISMAISLSDITMMVKSMANEKNQTLSLYSIFFSILGGHFEAPVSLMDAPLTLFRLDLVT